MIEFIREFNKKRGCVVQVVGPRDSGKTLLITELVRRLKREYRGLRVLVVKHSHHKKIDVEDKDSFRFISSGADLAIVAVESEYALFSREIDPVELVKNLDVDLIFVEGFREESLGLKIDLGETSLEKALNELYNHITLRCIKRGLGYER